jgi:FkbM family methyltransferase
VAATRVVQRLLASRQGQLAKEPIRNLVRRAGYELVESATHHGPAFWAKKYHVDTVVDVGANQGQFGRALRAGGYGGRIESFEPATAAFALLSRATALDEAWTAHNLALGDLEGVAELAVSRNSVSSSLLRPTEAHVSAAPTAEVVGTEFVPLTTLDKCHIDGNELFLKLDVQGYESRVIAGGSATLARCRLLQCEVSLSPTYEDGADWLSLLLIVNKLGFRPIAVYPGLTAEDKRQLQVDMLFERN